MPVHRHLHDKRGTVYAFRSELDVWWKERGSILAERNGAQEEAIAPELDPAGEAAEIPPAELTSRATFPAASRNAPRVAFIAAGFVLAALVAVAWISRNGVESASARPLPFKARDWVLVTSFENRTGRSAFDGTLEAALERALRESRYLNVVPRERVEDALLLMRKPQETQIDAALGREVCLRDGNIRALVTGKVEKLGPRYLLSVDLVDPRQGATVVSVTEEAAGETEALPAILRASDRLRKMLGESLPEPGPDSARLAKVTTRSLKALRLYSKAESLLMKKPAAAQELLTQVVAEDPEFAMGHMALSWSIFNELAPGDWSEALPHSETAFRLSESATDRERYSIRGGYYQQRNDAAKAVAAYEALLALYPDDLGALNDLVPIYYGLGRHPEAVRCAMRRADLTPNDFRNQILGILHAETFSGKELYVRRARTLVTPEVLDRVPQQVAFIEMFPAFRLWAEGDVVKGASQAERKWDEIASAELGRRDKALRSIASFFLSLGKLQAAEDAYQRVADPHLRLRGLALISYYRADDLRLVEHLKAAVAKRSEVPMWDFSGVPPGDPVLAILLARTGMLAEAEWIVAREKRRDGVPEFLGVFVRLVEAELAFARGRRAETIRLLDVPLDVPGPAPYFATETLASAMRERGDVDSAIRLLEPAERSKPGAITSNWDSDAHAWFRNRALLASLYRQAGRVAAAGKIEQDLSRMLSAADPDHPILVAVRKPASDTISSRRPSSP